MKTKRLFSIIMVLVIMVGCIGINVSAENETATISLLGETQAIVGSEYEVALNVKETSQDAVGGISTIIEYDSEKFELNRVEISKSFAEANHVSENEGTKTIDTATPGKISVLLLDVEGDGLNNDWLTFVFTANDETGNAEFEITEASASDAQGTKIVTSNLGVAIVNNVYPHMIDVKGASVRKDGTGNIRFQATIDVSILDKEDIKEIGVIILPTAFVNNGDLKFENDGKYTTSSGARYTVARAKKAVSDLPANFDGNFYAYLNDTLKFQLTDKFSARAYVITTNDEIIYSDNKIVENAIVGGTSSKSCAETAKAIATKFEENGKDLSAISDILSKEISKWTTEEYKEVVAALVAAEN